MLEWFIASGSHTLEGVNCFQGVMKLVLAILVESRRLSSFKTVYKLLEAI